MKKALLVVPLVLLAVRLLVRILGGGGSAGAGVRPVVGPEHETNRAADLVDPGTIPEEPEVPVVERTEVEVVAGADAPESAETPAAPAAVDKRAKALLEFLVVDRFDVPILDAKVTLVGLRTVKNRGDWHGWPGDPPSGATNRDGRVALPYPTWLSRSTGPSLEVAEVCFRVRHPEYVTHEDDGYDVSQGTCLVEMKRGAFLVVSGWIDSPAERISAVEAHVTDDAELPANAWVPLRDGRPSCNMIPPGRHAIYLTYSGGSGGPWTSEAVEFTLAEEEQKELHLQLLAPIALEGRFANEVPRPIANGAVELNLSVGGYDRSAPATMRTFRSKVAENGTFRFDRLPPGDGELIGMCDGWVSELVAFGEQGFQQPPPGADELDEQAIQWGDPGSQQGPFVLRMQPTASLAVTVLGPTGEPLPDARVYTWPNVHWRIGYADFFLGRTWDGMTDVNGRTSIVNLPPGSESLAVKHLHYQVPLNERERRYASAELSSGQTTRVTMRLEERQED